MAEPDVPTAQWFGWKRFQCRPRPPACSPALPLLQCLESLESAAACSSQSGKRRIRETEPHRFRRSGRLSCASFDKTAKKQRIPCVSVRFRQSFRAAIERIKRTSGPHQDRIRDEDPLLLPAQYRRQNKFSPRLPNQPPIQHVVAQPPYGTQISFHCKSVRRTILLPVW